MKTREFNDVLEQLGVDKNNFRVLGLLPLVYVAWADGKVRRAERSLIQRVAMQHGWLGDGGAELLAGWLETPPSSEDVHAGIEVLRSLASEDRGLGVAVSVDSLRSLVSYCRDVATAAGGYFGLHNPIDDTEEQALAEIARAFDIDDGQTWQRIALVADQHDHELPPGPKGHFLVGSLLEFGKSPLTFLMDVANEHGDVVYFKIAAERVFLLRRPEHIQHVLQDNQMNYARGREYEALARVVGQSLLTTDRAEWKRLRRIAQPAFHRKRVEGFATTITHATQGMLDRWAPHADDKASFDIAPEMMGLTLHIIGLLMFSTDLSDGASEIGQAVTIALEHANMLMINPLSLPEKIPTPENVRFNRSIVVFDDLLYRLIRERRHSASTHPDLLGMLIEARDEETGEGLSDEQLRNEMLTFLLAGHETTSIALTWTLYALSKHPTVARRVQAEIETVLGARQPTVADTKALSYTNMVIDESMRLYPPVWGIGREAQADDEVGGYRIPKGGLVFLSPWVTQRTAEFWPNPEGFDPLRFTKEAAAARHKDAYFPFAAGPHKCIGIGLAMLELQLILPMILQRYRLDLLAGFEPGFDPQITLRPKRGMAMTLSRV